MKTVLLTENEYNKVCKILNEYVNFKHAWELIRKDYNELTDDDKKTLSKYAEEMSKNDSENKLTKALITKSKKANGIDPNETNDGENNEKVNAEKPKKEYTDYEKALFKMKNYWGKKVNKKPSFLENTYKMVNVKSNVEDYNVEFVLNENIYNNTINSSAKLWKPIVTKFNCLEALHLKCFDNDGNEIKLNSEEEKFEIILKVLKNDFNLDLFNQYIFKYNNYDGVCISQLTKEEYQSYMEDRKNFVELLKKQPDVRHIHDWVIDWQTNHYEQWRCLDCGKTKKVYVD